MRHEQLTEGRFVAVVDMIRRTGALQFQIRHDEPDLLDPGQVVWIALAQHNVRGGMPQPVDAPGVLVWSVGAGLSPLAAVHALAERLIDGGTCAHCGRPSSFDPSDDPMSMPGVCTTSYDPELRVCRRECAADTR